MPNETNTNLRDLSPLRPYNKNPDLIALAGAALGVVFFICSCGGPC